MSASPGIARAGRRRLLVLCYFYPPLAGGGVHRVLSFTRWLPQHGWDCTVVCAGEGDYWVMDDSLTRQVPPGTEVLRVRGGSGLSAWLRLARGTPGRRSGRTFGVLRRLADWWLLPDSYAGWARRAARTAIARARSGGFDALLSSSPPDSVHLGARAVKRATGLPWVADFRDPWVGLHLRRPPTPWHRARQAALERSVLAGADLVLSASRTHADALEGRARRVLHLPNGFEPAPAAEAPPRDDGRFILVFTGTLSQMEDAFAFLDALAAVRRDRPELCARLRAVLAGPYDVDVHAHARGLGLEDVVEFPGPLAHERARALQRDADLLLLWKPRGFATMVPGKLYEYLDSGRPLLAILDPGDESAALARRGGATVVPSGEPAGIAAALVATLEAWRARGGTRASSARPAWLAEHERSHLAGRLAAALGELAR